MLNALLFADADAVVGAEWGKPSQDRVAQRNGYRHVTSTPGSGPSTFRSRSCVRAPFPELLLEHRKRAETALTTVVADHIPGLGGVSVQDVGRDATPEGSVESVAHIVRIARRFRGASSTSAALRPRYSTVTALPAPDVPVSKECWPSVREGSRGFELQSRLRAPSPLSQSRLSDRGGSLVGNSTVAPNKTENLDAIDRS